jgi:hypothetical protein
MTVELDSIIWNLHVYGNALQPAKASGQSFERWSVKYTGTPSSFLGSDGTV